MRLFQMDQKTSIYDSLHTLYFSVFAEIERVLPTKSHFLTIKYIVLQIINVVGDNF